MKYDLDVFITNKIVNGHFIYKNYFKQRGLSIFLLLV